MKSHRTQKIEAILDELSDVREADLKRLVKSVKRDANPDAEFDKRLQPRDAQDAKPGSCEDEGSHRKQSKMKGTVLVIADFLLTRTALRRVLRRAGYTVLEASDGSHSLERLDTHCVHLVIADVGIADGTGLEMVQRIRFNAKTANIPMVLCTAFTKTLDMDIAKLEIQGLLMKPIRPQAVLALVNEILSSPTK